MTKYPKHLTSAPWEERPPARCRPLRHTPPLRRSGSRWGPRVALLTAPAPTLTASSLWQPENREPRLQTCAPPTPTATGHSGTHPFTGLSALAFFTPSGFLLLVFTESGEALFPLPSLGDSARTKYKKLRPDIQKTIVTNRLAEQCNATSMELMETHANGNFLLPAWDSGPEYAQERCRRAACLALLPTGTGKGVS